MSPRHAAWWLVPGLVMGSMAVLKYASLHTAGFDMGVYLFNIFGVAHGEWWRMGHGHLQPALLLFAGLHHILPQALVPQALLAIQALLVFLPAPWLARRYGALTALAYVLYFPLWYVGLFDFHPGHLAVPLLAAFLLLEEDGRVGWACAAAMALCLVKEPFALQTAACGVYLMLRGRRRAGLLLMLAGAAYFLVAVQVVLPAMARIARDSLNEGYVWLGKDAPGIVGGLLSRPLDVLAAMFVPGKLLYVGLLLAGMAFVPLARPLALVCALPALAMSLLSDQPGHYGLGHHYSIGLAPVMAVAFGRGWAVLRPDRQRSGLTSRGPLPRGAALLLALWLAAVHVGIAPSPASRLCVTDKVWSYGWRAYLPTARDAWIKARLAEFIPTDPGVAVAAQNTLHTGLISQRRRFYVFDYGVFEPEPDPGAPFGAGEPVWAQWLVLDLRRPWYIKDQGCRYLHGRCTDAEAAQRFRERVAEARLLMDTVFDEDGLLILRRPDNP